MRRSIGVLLGAVVGSMLIGVVIWGTQGGLWDTVHVGNEAVTVPQSWHRQRLAHGVVFYKAAPLSSAGLWFYPPKTRPFKPGRDAEFLVSAQPGMVEWKVPTPGAVRLYGVVTYQGSLEEICIKVPTSQADLGLQILGSWQF